MLHVSSFPKQCPAQPLLCRELFIQSVKWKTSQRESNEKGKVPVGFCTVHSPRELSPTTDGKLCPSPKNPKCFVEFLINFSETPSIFKSCSFLFLVSSVSGCLRISFLLENKETILTLTPSLPASAGWKGL